MNLLFVAGTFGDRPKQSGYAYKLFTELRRMPFNASTFINGGSLDLLYNLGRETLGDYNVIVWMPEVDNSVPKIVENIKEIYPHALLVISKRIKRETPYLQLAARMLKVKANLMLEFTDESGLFGVRVFDPLGNQFVRSTIDGIIKNPIEYDMQDISVVASILMIRITQLLAVTRINTTCVGDCESQQPECNDFLEVARQHASTFHDLIHANTDRFLGNLSFRCENGFPSYRSDNIIYVSRRNIDKRDISASGFVPVSLNTMEDGKIGYYGAHKPSVDTPIQVGLYRYYRNVRYILHGHVYAGSCPPVPGEWPCTGTVLPCGAVEEAGEVIKLFPDRDNTNFCVNLLGHGFVALASDVGFLKNIKCVSRNVPELQVLSHIC